MQVISNHCNISSVINNPLPIGIIDLVYLFIYSSNNCSESDIYHLTSLALDRMANQASNAPF